MKKIITFLFCTAVLSSAFAQTDHHDWNDRNTNDDVYNNSNDNQRNYQHNDNRDDRNNRRYNNNYPGYQNNSYNIYQRDQLIQKINYQYDYQVQQVMNDWSLSRREKRNVIRNLQAQKAQQINNINYQYSNANVYNDNNYQRNNDYQRNNHHDDEDDGR